MREITIQELLNTLKRRRLLLFVLPTLLTVCALLACWLLPTHYTAVASLFVAVRYADDSGNLRFDTAAGNSLASDYKAIFERSPVLKSTAEALGIADLAQAVRVEAASVSGTRVVEVRATGSDAALCAKAANTAVRIFTDYLQSTMRVENAGVMQAAEVPEIPSSPRPLPLAVMVYCLALSLCASAVLVVEQLRDRVNADTQTMRQFGLPLLASVSDYRRALRRFLSGAEQRGARLYRAMPDAVREGVKAAAVSIAAAREGMAAQTFAVTSVTTGEGKSSLAVLLASAYAEEGERVLLVDMDVRNPSLGHLLNRRTAHDLSDYVAGRAPLSEVLVPTAQRNLHFIGSCHKKALVPRIVASGRFFAFLEEARTRFDRIIFDTPPLELFVDATVLAARLDGVVLAVADNRIESIRLQKGLDQLSRGKAAVLGMVLNYVPVPKAYGAYYGAEKRIVRARAVQWN